MKRSTLFLVGGMWLAVSAACSTGAGDGEGEGTDSEVDGVTEGGCQCPNITLECLCAEFPGSCATYDEIENPQSGEAAVFGRTCWDDSRWWVTEQRGCGKIIVTNAPNLGGFQLVYDEATLELIGAGLFSDVAFGSCGTAGYQAGASASCSEGTICSLCDAGACAPMCSIEAMQNTWGVPRYEDEARIDYGCLDPASGTELRVGCGKARFVSMWGTNTYSADTHELLAVENQGPACGSVWGDPGEPCAEETVCSLCDSAREATCRL